VSLKKENYSGNFCIFPQNRQRAIKRPAKIAREPNLSPENRQTLLGSEPQNCPATKTFKIANLAENRQIWQHCNLCLLVNATFHSKSSAGQSESRKSKS